MPNHQSHPLITFNKVVANCPNCGEQQFYPFGSREHLGYPLHYVICGNCTLIVMQSQMTDERLQQFYEEDYRSLYSDMQQPTATLLKTQQQRGNHLAQFFAATSGYNSNDAFNYLDIGCSTGVHLDAVKALFPNANMYGIEPGNEFRQFCNNKGLTVFSDINEMKAKGITADAICMSHVLEHIPEPAAYLSFLNETIAAANAFLLIEVPNTLGGHLSFELAHPICFYDQTLINTCHLAGFEKVAIKEHNVTSKYPELQYLTGLFRKSNTLLSPVDYSSLSATTVINKREQSVIRYNTKSFAFKAKRKLLKFFRDL